MSDTEPLNADDADLYLYKLAPDIEWIKDGQTAWLVQSSTRSIRLEGAFAQLLAEEIQPLLVAGCTFSTIISRFPALDPVELRQYFDEFVARSMLLRVKPSAEEPPAELATLLALTTALGLDANEIWPRLAQARIAIFGLEGVGAQLTVLLLQSGFRKLTLVDPYPCQPGDLAFLPLAARNKPGRSRQRLTAAGLRAARPAGAGLELRLGPAKLTRRAVRQLVAEADIVVSCFDRGFSRIHYAINSASLATNTPAIYAELRGHLGLAGPLVLPWRTACYSCYRMRAVACADDSAAALAYEEYLVQHPLPRLHQRAVLPSLTPQVAGQIATAILQQVLGFAQPNLAGQVATTDALSLGMGLHTVLRQPECPACGKPRPEAPMQPGLEDLLQGADGSPQLLQLAAPYFISSVTGIVREVSIYQKDSAEPAQPYISRVTLANHLIERDAGAEESVCWGKAMTRAAACSSGLGEALERYAAELIGVHPITYRRRAELDGPSIDPTELVLYRPEQYMKLPYSPYSESSVLGWVRGRSLVSNELVYLPALSIFLGYQPQSTEEYLFQSTSNGLAAAPSLREAVLAAAGEVLERDSFMITWFGRLPTQRIDPFSHPDRQVIEVCRAYQRRGVEIGLWRLPGDHPWAVFLALCLQGDGAPGPAAIAGLGADVDHATASRKAILEACQIRPSYRRSIRDPKVQQHIAALVAEPQRVASMRDHGFLYCSPEMRPALQFLLDRAPEGLDWRANEAQDSRTQLTQLVEYCRATGTDLLYYQLTPPDLACFGPAVARVIIPGHQPVAFGAQEQRLGGTRLYTLPQQLGLAPACLGPQDLNPVPHCFD